MRNLNAGQEVTVRTVHGAPDWFQIGKGVRQACILSPAYLTYMQSTSQEALGWRKNWNQDCQEKPQICRWNHPHGRKWRRKSEEELMNPLMNMKQESENIGLKLNIQITKIMASIPITSWQIDGETVETVSDFIFLGSKISADADCSHEIKRCLLLGRKVMTNLDSILKSRDITLPTSSI